MALISIINISDSRQN